MRTMGGSSFGLHGPVKRGSGEAASVVRAELIEFYQLDFKEPQRSRMVWRHEVTEYP